MINSASANDNIADTGAWEKWSLEFGGFIASTDTSFRLGSGAGVDIDLEELLDMDATNYVYRLAGSWRFSKNRKHSLGLNWFALRRSGETTIGQDIEIPDQDGDGMTTIPAGTKVESYFDIDVYQANYSYSFFMDERVDLSANFGLYIMPINFGLEATGLIDANGDAKFTAPLPVLGLSFDFALTPKWFIRSGTQIFYLQYENYTGGILATHAGIEYKPWKHFGIGLGADTFRLKAEADGEDYPEIDFKGNFEFNYVGLVLYGRISF